MSISLALLDVLRRAGADEDLGVRPTSVTGWAGRQILTGWKGRCSRGRPGDVGELVDERIGWAEWCVAEMVTWIRSPETGQAGVDSWAALGRRPTVHH